MHTLKTIYIVIEFIVGCILICMSAQTIADGMEADWGVEV